MNRPKLWLVIATVFTAINVAGGIQAMFRGEPAHTIAHLALTLIGLYAMARLLRGRRAQGAVGANPDDRITELQRSVDAIALEVERIGEAQRFISKLAAEQVRSPAPRKEP